MEKTVWLLFRIGASIVVPAMMGALVILVLSAPAELDVGWIRLFMLSALVGVAFLMVALLLLLWREPARP